MVPGAEPIGPLSPDFRGEHRPEPVPPEPDRLVTNIDATLMQQIFHVSKRQRKSDVHHHRKADHLG